MGLFSRRKARKRLSQLPNPDSQKRAEELADGNEDLNYHIVYAILSSGGTEEDAIVACYEANELMPLEEWEVGEYHILHDDEPSNYDPIDYPTSS